MLDRFASSNRGLGVREFVRYVGGCN